MRSYKNAPYLIDNAGFFANNKVYFVPSSEWFLVGLLNSNVLWFVLSSITTILRGGFRELFAQYVETLPIPATIAELDKQNEQEEQEEQEQDEQKSHIANLAEKCQQAAEARYKKQQELIGIIPSLHPNKQVDKLSTALQNWWKLDFAAFQKQISKEFKKDIPVKDLTEWKELLETGKQDIEKLTLKIATHERELNTAVYKLFDLDDAEIKLIESN